MKMVTFYFVHELAEQCMFVRMAKIDLKACKAMDTHGLNRHYYFLQSLLTALGNISKILWPIMKKGDEQGNEIRETRGKELREALNVKGDSALRSRKLRDTFEHFDERMDTWFGAEERQRFSDRNVGSMEGVIIPSEKDRLRTFDTETWTLTCLGKKFELSPAIKEAYELYEAIQEKTGQPGKKVQPLPGEQDE
jgi:hypothetical protein